MYDQVVSLNSFFALIFRMYARFPYDYTTQDLKIVECETLRHDLKAVLQRLEASRELQVLYACLSLYTPARASNIIMLSITHLLSAGRIVVLRTTHAIPNTYFARKYAQLT